MGAKADAAITPLYHKHIALEMDAKMKISDLIQTNSQYLLVNSKSCKRKPKVRLAVPVLFS